MEINVYDFDGTIYDGDSTRDFLFFLIMKKPKIILCFAKTPLYAVKWKLGIIHTKNFKEKVFKCFQKFDNLDSIVLDFWKKNEQKIKKFYLEKNHENDIICSASPEFLLKPICNKLQIKDLIATEVDSKTGIFLGENNKGKNKVKSLYKKYPNCIINEMYSDSLNDLPLFQIAKKSYLVKKNRVINYMPK